MIVCGVRIPSLILRSTKLDIYGMTLDWREYFSSSEAVLKSQANLILVYGDSPQTSEDRQWSPEAQHCRETSRSGPVLNS